MATQTTPSPTTSGGETNNQSTVDEKILADLDVLKEKLELCHTMLNPSDGSPAPSLTNNDALLGLIGFIEACAPRMRELVEAAAQGAVSDHVLEECLKVNDHLVNQLADIDTYAETETPASTTVASTPKPSLHDDLEDLLLDDDAKKKDETAAAGKSSGEETSTSGKTSGEEDPFGNDLLAPAEEDTSKPPTETTPTASDLLDDLLAPDPTSDTAGPATTETAKDADFDAFFEERTSSN